MTTTRFALIIATVALLAGGTAVAQIATDWLTTTDTTATGDLGAVSVTVTDVGTPQYPPLFLPYDLSTADYAPYQLAAAQECLDYSFDTNWSATFSSPVTDLLLYCKFWRGPNNGSVDPPTFDYEFDQPFTIVSGFGNSSVSGNTLVVPSDLFQDGILRFSGAVTSVSVLSNNANSASRQGLTFGLEEEPVSTEAETWTSVKEMFR